MDNDQIRVFIAVEFPLELKDRLRDFQSKLKDPGQSFVKWVDPELMHFTLKFLDNQSPQNIDIIRHVLEVCSASCKPFYLSTGQTGCFPGPKNVRVCWIGLGGDIDQLSVLQMSIEKSLTKEGFPRDNHPFTAHLTLARLRDECSMQNRSAFAAQLQKARFEPDFSFLVDRVALMKSTLTPRGPIYNRLVEYWLSV